MESGSPERYCRAGDEPGGSETDWQVPAFDARFWLGRQSYWAVLVPFAASKAACDGELERRLARLAQAGLCDVVVVGAAGAGGSLESQRLQAAGVRALLDLRQPAGMSSRLRCGYAFLMGQGYDGVISVDGAGIDDLARVRQVVEALDDGFDLVQGSGFARGGLPALPTLWRVLRGGPVKRIAAAALSLSSGFRWTDCAQQVRGYSRRLLLDPRVALFRDGLGDDDLPVYLPHRAPRLGFSCLELPAGSVAADGQFGPSERPGMLPSLRLLRSVVKVCAGRLDPPRG